MPLNWATLRGAALVLFAALLLHALRYLSAYGGDAGDVLTDHGHAYLAFVAPVVATLVALAFAQFGVALSAARREADRRPRRPAARPPWWLYSVLLVVIYVSQEQIEAFVNDDHPGGIDGVLGRWGWLAVVLAIALGPVIAWLVRGADVLVERVARKRAAPRAKPERALPRPHPADAVPRDPAAWHSGGRAPPQAADASQSAGDRSFLERKLLTLLLRVRRARYLRRATVTPRDDLARLGSPNAAWTVPGELIDSGSVCYLVGVGEDASFDLALIDHFGCTVQAFDPVPRARRYAEGVAATEPRWVFRPEGVWSEDTTLQFHLPRDPRNVSMSAVDLHGTSAAVDAEVRSLPSLMRELGHDRIDVLKISAEGSEFEILDHMLDEQVDVRVLCVEFSMPAPPSRIDEALGQLKAEGYDLVVVDLGRSGWSWRFTLVRG